MPGARKRPGSSTSVSELEAPESQKRPPRWPPERRGAGQITTGRPRAGAIPRRGRQAAARRRRTCPRARASRRPQTRAGHHPSTMQKTALWSRPRSMRGPPRATRGRHQPRQRGDPKSGYRQRPERRLERVTHQSQRQRAARGRQPRGHEPPGARGQGVSPRPEVTSRQRRGYPELERSWTCTSR